MLTHETQIRVRYASTDQMGFVYNGRYVEFMEVGRVEMMRDLGMPYAEVEARGIWMPVADLQIKFRRPAHYDDLLTIKTSVNSMPTSSMIFEYEMYREDGTHVLSASTRLAFVSKETNRPIRVPDFVVEILKAKGL